MATRVPVRLRRFVQLRPEVEAVLQHVGRRTWDVVLVDVEGNWEREEVPTPEAAEALCSELGIRLQRGWDDQRLARRMGRRDHWRARDGQRRAL